jgi:phosphinothricin acetyltransferase
MRARLATPADAIAIARIYNEGIDERSATFETRHRTVDDVLAWFDGAHPNVAVEEDDGRVIAFAHTHAYRSRECYRGVFEFTVYVDREHRRRGAGGMAMRELATQARAAGAWKLLSRIFVENQASRALVAELGFREVGTYYRHAKLDGEWRDVVVVEKFLAPVTGSIPPPPPGQASREDVLAGLRAGGPGSLDQARALLAVYRRPDSDLLLAAIDAFFASKTRDSATRAKFVELYRTYAASSRDAGRELYDFFFARLERWSLPLDLDGFYEALIVVKQVAGADGVRDLAPHVHQMIAWIEQAVDLPATRGRISPGNVTALLMPLALAAAESEEQKQRVAELANDAKARLRLEAPASLRAPPAMPSPPPPAPPPPAPPSKKKAARKPRKKKGSA